MAQPSDTRYEHLLQPIRDLAANWSVDIANELESYLEVLEGVQFSFSDGPSMNFAEGASAVPGCSCCPPAVGRAGAQPAARRRRDGTPARPAPAAAALLIQGSACIYSKKVEYLHTLVYQALEFIAERRCVGGRGGAAERLPTGCAAGRGAKSSFSEELER